MIGHRLLLTLTKTQTVTVTNIQYCITCLFLMSLATYLSPATNQHIGHLWNWTDRVTLLTPLMSILVILYM